MVHQRNEVAATRAALAQCKAAPAAVASKSCGRSTETFRKLWTKYAEVYNKYRLEGWEILMHIHTYILYPKNVASGPPQKNGENFLPTPNRFQGPKRQLPGPVP